MHENQIENNLQDSFEKFLSKDRNSKNAFLSVHSSQLGVHVDVSQDSNHRIHHGLQQPHYMASVGKIFTAMMIGMLKEKGKLRFEDTIAEFLDSKLLSNLHWHKGKDCSKAIEIKHLLGHTSGIADHFRPLLDKLVEDRSLSMTPQEAISWTKTNVKTHFAPGHGFHYSDTNYHLLGLIIEGITKMPFHAALKELIFDPIGMKHSFMLHYSKPEVNSSLPMAEFYYKGFKLNEIEGYGDLDYAGGGIVSTPEELLKFMKALTANQIVRQDTLCEMMSHVSKMGLGIHYGYGIWQIVTVPFLMPQKLNSWGVAGATGAFLFYHPLTASYVIGNFNDFSYERKALRFMLLDVMSKLSKEA